LICFGRCTRAFQVRRTKVECCRDERFVKTRRVNAKNFFAELKRRQFLPKARATQSSRNLPKKI
jgi:hypothetical protein